MSSVRKLTVAGLVVLGTCGVFGAPAWAGGGYGSVSGKFGEPCKSTPCGPGQFNKPTAVAVNDTSGDVYVVDSGDNRVEWFNATGTQFEGQFDGSGEYEIKAKKETGTPAPTGKFSRPEGIAVNNDPSSATYGDIYVADAGHGVVDEFSATGEYKGQLTGGECENEGETPPCAGSPSKEPIKFSGELNVATDPAGDLWVYEAGVGTVYNFNDSGSIVGVVPGLGGSGRGGNTDNGFAIDPEGDIYVTAGSRVIRFKVPYTRDNTGTYEREFLSESASPLATLAIIDSTNELLVDNVSKIELYGTPFVVFPSEGLSDSAGIAVNGAEGEGTIYASQRGADDVAIIAPSPPEAPTVLSESASNFEIGLVRFSAAIDAGNRTTTYSFEYSTEGSTSNNTLSGAVETLPGEAALPAKFGEQAVSAVNTKETVAKDIYYYRVVAKNSLGTTYGKVQADLKRPTIDSESVSGLTTTGATLETKINPLALLGTTYQFEYATSESQLGTPEATIAGEGELEQVFEEEPVSVTLNGLKAYTTYYYRAVGKNQNGVENGETVKFRTQSVPFVNTGEAANITRTSATLSGTINPADLAGAYYFQYVSETAYQAALANGREPYSGGESTVPLPIAASEAENAIAPVLVSGLLSNTTYHYRLVAKNEFGAGYGPELTFRTSAKLLPQVSTGGVSGVSQNSATLSGTVGTNGLQTDYGFEIATEPGQYSPATGLGSIGGAETESVSTALSELQPGTTYYYRIFATNDDGTSYGEVATFATPGFPVLLTPQSELPVISVPSTTFPTTSQENTGTVKTKALTKAQKLANALKVCKKDKNKQKRASCEKQAHKKYGAATKKKK